MQREKLAKLYKEYGLSADDVFKHQHYMIITRGGIEKIAAKADVRVRFSVEKLETNFAVIKATAAKGVDPEEFSWYKNDKDENPTPKPVIIETYGSALKGEGFKDGNCNTWYVAEMAEKRALSRAVLKLTGFYELGVFGEDESEDFKRGTL